MAWQKIPVCPRRCPVSIYQTVCVARKPRSHSSTQVKVHFYLRFLMISLKRLMIAAACGCGGREFSPRPPVRYAYANNNPYKFTDPDGRQSNGRQLCGASCDPKAPLIKVDQAIKWVEAQLKSLVRGVRSDANSPINAASGASLKLGDGLAGAVDFQISPTGKMEVTPKLGVGIGQVTKPVEIKLIKWDPFNKLGKDK